MKLITFYILIFLTCSAKAMGGVQLPELGGSADNILSPTEMRQIGEAFMRRFRRNAEIITDPQIVSYINALGDRLLSHSDSPAMHPFTFFVVKAQDINAFAVPGGFIGVHSGLILTARTESELASVLAHEIAHVTQQHIVRQIESGGKLSIPVIAAVIAAIVAGIKHPQIGQAALATAQAGALQMQIQFTRIHEKEADRIGMQILAEAGLDPQSMPAFFERLQAANRYDEGSGPPDFLRTHPVTTDRVAESRERAEQYASQARQEESADFHLARAKLLVLTHSNPRQLMEQLQKALKNGEYRDERAVRYALALSALEQGRSELGSEQVDWLFKHDGDRVVYRLLTAKLAHVQGRAEEALGHYAKALHIYPNDISLSMAYAQALLEHKQPAKAIETLLKLALGEQYSDYRQLLAAYQQLLAVAQKADGQIGAAYLSLAEYYYLNGQTHLAIEQLKQALHQEDQLDFYTLAKIEARLTQLEEEFAQERKHTDD